MHPWLSWRILQLGEYIRAYVFVWKSAEVRKMGNGKKRVKHLVLSVNRSSILTTTLTWKAKLSHVNDKCLWAHLFCSVAQACSSRTAAQPVSVSGFRRQFRGRPTLLMPLLTTARSWNVGRSSEKIFLIFFLLKFPFSRKWSTLCFLQGKLCKKFLKLVLWRNTLYFRSRCIGTFENMHITELLL